MPMSDSFSSAAWLLTETARHYQTFTAKTTMYQELSQFMVQLADIQPGMRILDLGCGTGVTSEAVLQILGPSGHIYALDVSDSMLAVARQQVQAKNATFLQADAADVVRMLADQAPVDRIVCNSVFWQFRHKAAVLTALRQILTPQGLFVFNVPQPYFIFKDIPYSPKVSILFKQLIAERYGVGQQDLRTMRVFFEHHGFEIVTTQEFERTRSAEESYLFFKLPVATAWMEPPLDYETRMAVLEEAQQMAESDKTSQQRWMYFVTRLTK